MASPSRTLDRDFLPRLPPAAEKDLPILYEDEDAADMGETNPHVLASEIIHLSVKSFLAPRPELRVYSDLNCYYRKGPRHPRTRSLPYFSADVMVVRPTRPLGEDVRTYTIGVDGPAPLQTVEVLSRRSAKQGDLRKKPELYALLGIGEYLLIDPAGKWLAERLLLRRLGSNRKWRDEQDADGGITSRLGYRLIWDSDGQLRLIDAATGKRFARPDEAQAEAEARQVEAEMRRQAEEVLRAEAEMRRQAEERIRQLEAELARIRQDRPGTSKRRKRRKT
jgi:Uma2 family endonuclease